MVSPALGQDTYQVNILGDKMVEKLDGKDRWYHPDSGEVLLFCERRENQDPWDPIVGRWDGKDGHSGDLICEAGGEFYFLSEGWKGWPRGCWKKLSERKYKFTTMDILDSSLIDTHWFGRIKGNKLMLSNDDLRKMEYVKDK